MIRNASTAALAAAGIMFAVIATAGSGAIAQENPNPVNHDLVETVPATPAPVFIEREVVQPVPHSHAASDSTSPAGPQSSIIAASLPELVDRTPADGPLSEELLCLAGAVYFESRGEPLEGQLAVAQVVINRSESRLFPASYCGVVTQRAQFSFVRNGRIPEARTSSEAWRRAVAIARIAHQGQWESEAGDALYFHANYVRPGWSRSKIARATIDSHIFYR